MDFDPFRDQKTLWPKDIIKIINLILKDLGRLGVELTAEEIVDLEIFELGNFSFQEVQEIIKKYKAFSRQENFYVFYVSIIFSTTFSDKWEKIVLLKLIKFWKAVLNNKQIEEYLKKTNSFVSFKKFIKEREKLRKKLKK